MSASTSSNASLSPCGDEARRQDNDRYLTALFAPEAARETVFALIALNAELARTSEVVSEPALGLMRLQWWRDQIEACREGGPLAGHPVLSVLGPPIRDGALSVETLEALIDARERDLDDEPFHTIADLEAYAESVSAPLIRLTLQALGATGAGIDPKVTDAAADAATAFALIGGLRSTAILARRGRVILPMAVLERNGIRRKDVTSGEGGAGLAACVAEVAEVARGRLARARAGRGATPRGARSAFLVATLAGRSAERLRAVNHDVFDLRVLSPDPWRHLALAWAAATGRF